MRVRKTQILKSDFFDSFLIRLFIPNNPSKDLVDPVTICVGSEQHCNRHAVASFGQLLGSARICLNARFLHYILLLYKNG